MSEEFSLDMEQEEVFDAGYSAGLKDASVSTGLADEAIYYYGSVEEALQYAVMQKRHQANS